MPKIKIKRKSTLIDMTAMCDVAFLLLTFFMLTTKFKPEEVVSIDIPPSRSELIMPDKGVMVINLEAGGKAYFSLDNQQARLDVLDKMSEIYNVKFTDKQKNNFKLTETFGVPIRQLPALLDIESAEEKKNFVQNGIPMDTTNNELGDWILQARYVDPKMRIAIKGDRKTEMPAIARVIAILQERKANKFNLITTLRTASNQ